MGDSVVEGWGVDEDKRFSYLLDNKMEDYEIVNLGVMGYNLKQEVGYLKEEGLKYSPDYVLFFITFNDLELHAGEIDWLSEEIGDRPIYSAYYSKGIEQKLLDYDIYRYFYLFKSKFIKKSFNESVYYKIDDIDGILDELVSLSRDFKIGFVFLPLPSKTPALQMEKIKNKIDAYGIKSLDLHSNMINVYGVDYVDSLFFDSCHLNEQSHLFLSELLYENIYGFIEYVDQ